MTSHSCPTNRTSIDPDLASAPPLHDSDTPLAPISPNAEQDFKIKYEGPLYTEIKLNIPRIPTTNVDTLLPPTSPAQPQSPSSTRQSPPTSRPHTFFPSSQRSALSSKESEEWPRIRRDIVKSRETAATMNLSHQSKKGRRGTVGALAVVPAVLVLSAELFTPGTGGGAKWQDGIR